MPQPPRPLLTEDEYDLLSEACTVAIRTLLALADDVEPFPAAETLRQFAERIADVRERIEDR